MYAEPPRRSPLRASGPHGPRVGDPVIFLNARHHFTLGINPTLGMPNPHQVRTRVESAVGDVDDGLDPLSDAAEFPDPGSLCCVGADRMRAERAAGKALVADDDLAGLDRVPAGP